jgi:hypothetical protein
MLGGQWMEALAAARQAQAVLGGEDESVLQFFPVVRGIAVSTERLAPGRSRPRDRPDHIDVTFPDRLNAAQ